MALIDPDFIPDGPQNGPEISRGPLCLADASWIFSPRNCFGCDSFIIIFNDAALRPNIPRPSWPFFLKKSNDPAEMKMKLIDDLSIAVKVNLEDHLEADLGRQKPLNFAERFKSKLTNEGNIMQEFIDNLKVFATERQMVINKEKTSIMKPLFIRRQELCEQFSVKTASDKSRHSDLFQMQNKAYNTRHNM